MRMKKKFSAIASFLLTLGIAYTNASAQSNASKEEVLVNFNTTGFSGDFPSGDLISDAAGNLYGVTSGGGIKGNGTVFEVSPAGNGKWTTKSLYRFQPNDTDGNTPVGGLVMDSAGNLYGTTSTGGSQWCTDDWDDLKCGTVFELSPNGSGGWSEKIIFDFNQQSGWYPTNSLTIDAAGNLYGVTNRNIGTDFGGTVFELQRSGEEWTYTILHVFDAIGDGSEPSGKLIFDKSGNLYGETYVGGSASNGAVFRLTNTGSGWNEEVLYSFGAGGSKSTGMQPLGGLVWDSAGNLYGVTDEGGQDYADGCGVVFELSPTSSGSWNETLVHTFQCTRFGYLNPWSGVVFDSAGNLYGTVEDGGFADLGTLYKLQPSGNGEWKYSVVHNFLGGPGDGSAPSANVLFDAAGNLFSTTTSGGTSGGGTVFELTH